MHLSFLDWLIVAALPAGLILIATTTRRYSRSVSDFLAGNRSAGRYLLTMSEGVTSLGLVGIIANFEQFYRSGFAAGWWGNILAPTAMIIALSGWVVYRFRQTRALTMAQFFEMRYSRNFRIFAGITSWVSGVLNYGIFPSIVARFLIYFCALPPEFHLVGFTLSTFPVVMFVMLGTAVCLTLSGGMITVMITDFFQAQLINIVFLTVMGVMVMKFSWPTIVQTLETAPRHESLLNPMDQSEISDFNIWFFLILAFKSFYNCLGWQGTQGYNSSAKSPHEAKMARILAEWRNGVSFLMLMLLPVCAYVLLHNPQFSHDAAAVHAALATIPDTQLREEMTVPMALSQILPAGIAGLFLAAMIGSAAGNDSTYLHSWGSIFIQDVILPFRKTPLSLPQHLFWLRISIGGVALFAFLFSLVFPLHDYIYMYFLITGAIYLGGSGAVIIGGLYWKRGTTAGAWAGLITGGVLAAGGAFLRAVWPLVPALSRLVANFPLNGAWMALVASISAIFAYVTVSLCTYQADFDLDGLLHRGRFAISNNAPLPVRLLPDWKRRLGITEEFTLGDQVIYFFKIGWTFFWFTTFILGTTVALIWPLSGRTWSHWWLFTIIVTVVVGMGTIVWFLWGGLRDLRRMLAILKTERIDTEDDGTSVLSQTMSSRSFV
jgi:SSS family solute:Na+ symporter